MIFSTFLLCNVVNSLKFHRVKVCFTCKASLDQCQSLPPIYSYSQDKLFDSLVLAFMTFSWGFYLTCPWGHRHLPANKRCNISWVISDPTSQACNVQFLKCVMKTFFLHWNRVPEWKDCCHF